MKNLFLTPNKKYEKNGGTGHRAKQVAFRLTLEEYDELQKLAGEYTGGNVSDFVRTVYLQWFEALTKNKIKFQE